MRSYYSPIFLAILCGLALIGCSPSGGDAEPAPLNVLFITADDLGLQLGAYGDTVIATPNIDKLAASGVQFNTAYVAQASCSPSRSAMFTGLYVHGNGQYGLTNASEFSLQNDDCTKQTVGPSADCTRPWSMPGAGRCSAWPATSRWWDRN